MRIFQALLLGCFLTIIIQSCAFRRIVRTKNIAYVPADSARSLPAQRLNIFAPRRGRHAADKPVLIYIHGGNWTNGRKGLYSFFGSRLARKGVVAVIIDYPLSPAARWDVMANDAAAATLWTQAHIAAYGGDPRRIYVSGHSAGGHLAALISLSDAFYKDTSFKQNPVAGTILIDAAGLDMYGYLKHEDGLLEEPTYATTFTNNEAEWARATPLFYIDGYDSSSLRGRGQNVPTRYHSYLPPMLIFRGGRTYPSIIRSNEKFVGELRKAGAAPQYILQPKKKHIPMITQFLNTANPRYRDILRFMKAGR